MNTSKNNKADIGYSINFLKGLQEVVYRPNLSSKLLQTLQIPDDAQDEIWHLNILMNFCSDLSCQCYRRHITLSHTQRNLSRGDTIITLYIFCNSHVQGKNIIRDFFWRCKTSWWIAWFCRHRALLPVDSFWSHLLRWYFLYLFAAFRCCDSQAGWDQFSECHFQFCWKGSFAFRSSRSIFHRPHTFIV